MGDIILLNGQPNALSGDNNRFTVNRASMNTPTGEKKVFMILDNGVPAGPINRHLIINQVNQSNPKSGDAYILKGYLNDLNIKGIDIFESTRADVYDFVHDVFLEKNPLTNKSYAKNTINQTIFSLGRAYESLYLQGYRLHESILVHQDGAQIISNDKKSKRITNIGLLKKVFLARKDDVDRYAAPSYLKWYSAGDVIVIKAELPLTHRCIFLITVYCGYRIDSVLSMPLQGLDLKNQFLMPPIRTKTGRKHPAYIPDELAQLLYAYILEVRNPIVAKTGSTSDALFLNRDGNPVTYSSYYKALRACGERLRSTRPELGIDLLHTHAGRSTFLAVLRSYQLECRRKGVKTITDEELCMLMDWKSIKNLEHYDIMTRPQDAAPLYQGIYEQFPELLAQNKLTSVFD